MRSFVMTTFALALALAPAAAYAQPPTQQPPAQQPPASGTQPPAAPQTAPPKLTFTTPAGMLLVQIKADQTATFEEMISKLKAGLAKSSDATLKQQATGLKAYKATEPGAGGNAFYVVLFDPAVPSAETDLFVMLQRTMTPEEQRAPETAELFKKYAAAFVPSGMSKLSLTSVGGGM